MKNKTTTYKWAYLPFVFSSAAILATQATAGPTGTQRYQDAKQVSSINHEYVGGTSQIGVGVDDEGNIDAEFNQVISESENHSTGVGLWAGYDLKGDDKGVLGRGGQVNHAWVSRDAAGRATRVNKTFVAYDRNEAGHDKATVGYGQENEHLFWDGRVSKGLSGNKDTNENGISDRAYEWGVGATVGKFLPNANARIRAGIDHEWSGKVGSGEKDARNTTLSAGIEKFFQGTGHSVTVDVAGSKNSGGYRFDNQDDTDVTGRVGYKYDFGGSSIYQPDRRYRRVRVEVPGQAVAPRYAQKQQYKKVPTYKTVPVYGNKTVRTPTKQLVKSTMELEGQTFFKLNSSKLIPSAQTRLKQIAAQIRKTGYKGSIRITGNTCGLGDARYDQILSEKRAKEVRNFLIKNGFNPNHLIARGLGKDHPKYARTPDQDFKNRRVDIEYVSQQQAVKTGYKNETKRVQTGTRQVATGFKNVPAGMKNVMISNGRPGAPRVIWKTEAIPTSPAWIKRALHNNIQHDRGVNTYSTSYGNDTVAPETKAPTANDDSTITQVGTAVTIDVLGNDASNSGSGQLTVTSVGAPQNGTAQIVNGQVVYTPNADYVGTDSFTYTITDSNGETAIATATVTVEGIKPEAENDSATTSQGTAVTLDVLDNDTTNSGSGELTISSIGSPGSGTAVIVGGEIVYTPSDDFVGTDTFTYTITDSNGATATATATVTVTADEVIKPEAQNDSATTSEGTAVTLDVLDNDTTNSGSGELTISSVGNPQRGTARIVDGQIVYTPNAGFSGTDRFTYTITDSNGETATATATVTVIADAVVRPVAQNDSATTDKGEAVTLDVLDNDTSNSGSGQLTILSVGSPQNGTARIVNGEIVYTPSADFVGIDTFTYTIRDSNGQVATATATVTVNDTDDSVKANSDDRSTDKNTGLTIDVLGNDDADAELVAGSLSTPNKGGTVSIVNGKVKYTPATGFVGVETFTYQVKDDSGNTDTATVTVTVNDTDDSVKANSDDRSTDKNTGLTIDVLENDDTDAELVAGSLSTPNKGGTVSIVNGKVKYTPATGFVGVETFTYQVEDASGNTDTATVTVTVNDVIIKPIAKDDSVSTACSVITIDALGNDTGDGLSLVSVDAGSLMHGTAVMSGNQIIYSPSNTCGKGNTGADNFSYTISDANGNTDTGNVKVTVNGVTDGGNTKANMDDAMINGGETVTLNVLANDTGKGLRIIAVDTPANGQVTFTGSTVTYTASHTGSYTDTFYYDIVDDNGYNDSAMIIVDVVKGCPTGMKCN